MSDDCYCDYDPPEWATIRHIKAARKQHKCTECGAPIFAGEPYEYINGMWGGYIHTFKTCERCLALRKWALDSVRCFCWSYGNLLDDVHEMVNEYAPQVPGFFFEYGRQVVNIRRERQRRKEMRP